MGNAIEIVDSSKDMIAERRSQQDFALANPRNEKAILEGALAELAMVPELAEKSFYVIPYEDKKTGKTVNVEGPSIKAAMALGRRWGNCTNGARVADGNDERIIVEGVFIDLQTNVRTLRTISVSRYFVSKKTKQRFPLREDRLNMAIQAGMSKAVRNATLATLPAYLVEAHFAEAKRIAGGGKIKGSKVKAAPVPERYKKMYAQFEILGVDQKAVDSYINGQVDPLLDESQVLGHMIGIYNAIKDQQTSVETVFGSDKKSSSSAAGDVKTSDLGG